MWVMSKLRRLSISLDEKLVEAFDRQIAAQNYPTRSKAIGDLIRESLTRSEWVKGRRVAGAILMVYDHHRHNLLHHLTAAQHKHHHLVIATQHFHLDHDNCLEIIAVQGKPGEIDRLYQSLRSVKGLKYCSLAAATTGSQLA